MEGAQLLEEVLASPDDDAPRLVYADWLVERGDPRGELIQLQCHAERHGRTARASDREDELIQLHAREWLEPLLPSVELTSVRFRRGFLDQCVLDLDGPASFTAEAWRTVTRLYCRQALPVEAAANLPSLRALCGFPVGLLPSLARTPLAERLEEVGPFIDGNVDGLDALPPRCALSPMVDVEDIAEWWAVLRERGLAGRVTTMWAWPAAHVVDSLAWMQGDGADLPSLAQSSDHRGLVGSSSGITYTLARGPEGWCDRLHVDVGGSDGLTARTVVIRRFESLLAELESLRGFAEVTLFSRLPYLRLRSDEAAALRRVVAEQPTTRYWSPSIIER